MGCVTFLLEDVRPQDILYKNLIHVWHVTSKMIK